MRVADGRERSRIDPLGDVAGRETLGFEIVRREFRKIGNRAAKNGVEGPRVLNFATLDIDQAAVQELEAIADYLVSEMAKKRRFKRVFPVYTLAGKKHRVQGCGVQRHDMGRARGRENMTGPVRKRIGVQGMHLRRRNAYSLAQFRCQPYDHRALSSPAATVTHGRAPVRPEIMIDRLYGAVPRATLAG